MHRSFGYNSTKNLSESNTVMSFPLASTPLSMCPDKMLVHTQFTVTSANNITPSLASSNEGLALANSLKGVRTSSVTATVAPS